jgi:cyclopropane-fatty-acyl-phospholipid synthase
MNYQDLVGHQPAFDRVISVGMYEHVGRHNQATYFKTVDALLAEGGVSVLHTISAAQPDPSDPWIDKYIFPGGYLPTLSQITASLEKSHFHLQDYENLRLHYAMTLDEWSRRFERHKAMVIKMYDERFYRMWRLYLASSSAGFRWGDLDLSQLVFTKGVNNNLPLTRDHLYAEHKKSAN